MAMSVLMKAMKRKTEMESEEEREVKQVCFNNGEENSSDRLLQLRIGYISTHLPTYLHLLYTTFTHNILPPLYTPNFILYWIPP